MNFRTAEALAIGLVTFVTALKALPWVWNTFLWWVAFFRSVPEITKVAALASDVSAIRDDVGSLSAIFESHQKQREVVDIIRDLVEKMPADIDAAAIKNITAAFQAHTAACGAASYVMATSTDGDGRFIWANPSWFKLHGLTEAEAINGQAWATVDPADYQRVRHASDTASATRTRLSVTYTLINLVTGERCEVHANAWPLIPSSVKPGDQVVYLGSIRKGAPPDLGPHHH